MVLGIDSFFGGIWAIIAAWVALFLLYIGLLKAYSAFDLIVRAAFRAATIVRSGVAQSAVIASLSGITPPIAIAVIVAAEITGSNFWMTCLEAVKLAAPLYALPFTFVYNPEIVVSGFTLLTFVSLRAVAIIHGLIILQAPVRGWARRECRCPDRVRRAQHHRDDRTRTAGSTRHTRCSGYHLRPADAKPR